MNAAVVAAVVSGVCALVAALVTAVAAQSARYVSRALRVEITQQRLDAYRALWGLTRAGAAGIELDLAARRQLEDELFAWYFTSGNGILLSDRARDVLVELQTCLRDDATSWPTAVELMAVLRTSLREDVGSIRATDRRRRLRQRA